MISLPSSYAVYLKKCWNTTKIVLVCDLLYDLQCCNSFLTYRLDFTGDVIPWNLEKWKGVPWILKLKTFDLRQLLRSWLRHAIINYVEEYFPHNHHPRWETILLPFPSICTVMRFMMGNASIPRYRIFVILSRSLAVSVNRLSLHIESLIIWIKRLELTLLDNNRHRVSNKWRSPINTR